VRTYTFVIKTKNMVKLQEFKQKIMCAVDFKYNFED